MFVKNKTVDGIVSGFRRTVDQLRDLAASHGDAISQRHLKIADLHQENHAAVKEQSRAIQIANKLEEIFG